MTSYSRRTLLSASPSIEQIVRNDLASVVAGAIDYQANALTIDLDGTDPGVAGRVDAALRASRVRATVTRSPDGSIRITASNA